MKRPRLSALLPLAVILVTAGLLGPACDSSENQFQDNPFSELAAQGITKHLGRAEVREQSTENGVTTYTFDPESGPLCLRGDVFRTAVRDTDSDKLFIYLSGGGACWSDFCQALKTAHPGIPLIDITNPESPTNPVHDWDMIYIPCCDGSLLAGEAEYDDDEDGVIDRYHYGLKNLTAALEIAWERFPSPAQIFLAGSSAGGIGTIVAAPLVRLLYPDVPLSVFNDAGVGIVKADDPRFVADLLDEYNARRFIPESCPDCIANGHLTRLVEWALERDPDLKIGAFSSYADKVFATIFLRIPADEFARELENESTYLNTRFPDRFKMFLAEGEMHTCLVGDYSVIVGDMDLGDFDISTVIDLGRMHEIELDGVTVAEWIGLMLNDDPGWVPLTAR